MKKILLLILLTLLVPTAIAQNAIVIKLDASDAAKAKQLYDAKTKAATDYEILQTEIAKKYLEAGKDELAGCSGNRRWKAGWGCGGYEFSKDFKFIVPKETPSTSGTINTLPYYRTPCTNLTCGGAGIVTPNYTPGYAPAH